MRPADTARCALLFCVAAACGDSAGSRSATNVTDSAGVQIVTSARPQWAAGEGWRIADSPLLTIGDSPTSPMEEFTTIRRVLTLADGGIIVANANRPAEIRRFDAAGVPLRTIGRPGAGPGELRAIWDVWLAAPDTLVVFDPGMSRVTYFDLDGAAATASSRTRRAVPAAPQRRSCAAAPMGPSSIPWARSRKPITSQCPVAARACCGWAGAR